MNRYKNKLRIIYGAMFLSPLSLNLPKIQDRARLVVLFWVFFLLKAGYMNNLVVSC